MNDFLLFYLAVVGLLALYWVLFGEKRFQKMIKKDCKSDENLDEKSEYKINSKKINTSSNKKMEKQDKTA